MSLIGSSHFSIHLATGLQARLATHDTLSQRKNATQESPRRWVRVNFDLQRQRQQTRSHIPRRDHLGRILMKMTPEHMAKPLSHSLLPTLLVSTIHHFTLGSVNLFLANIFLWYRKVEDFFRFHFFLSPSTFSLSLSQKT